MTDVSVVVPYYRDQAGLDRLLAALEVQTIDGFEVIVSDDGSPEPPVTGDRPYRVRVVRQEDRGFRAAAARNLGAAAATGAVLAFLDGDMMPEPGYLAAMSDATRDGALCVGRRRHADLTGWSADDVGAWLAGRRDAPPVLTEPRWLADGYAGTADLARADDRSFRYVISAVLACRADDFARLGGFADLVGYGGEDWDLAYRWRLDGGPLRHVPDAVAWHDGPDFAGRLDPATRLRDKDAETLRLAPRLTVPGARDPRLVWQVPDIAVRLDASALTPAQTVAVVAPLVDGSDAGVWVTGLHPLLDAALEDPRVRAGEPPQGSRWRVEVRRPGVLTGTTLAALVADVAARPPCDPAGGPARDDAPVVVRHVPTGRTWAPALPTAAWAPLPDAATTLEQQWHEGRLPADLRWPPA